MSADWFFLKTGFFSRHKTVGPISEPDLLSRISKGEITPETMLSSASKTHGQWIPMKKIRAAMDHWDRTHPKTGGSV
jgi:hypothetical protein